jgi:hypothetical protein
MLLAVILARLVVAIAAVQSTPDDLHLLVVVRESAEPGSVDLELTNTAAKPVVAWQIEFVEPGGGRSGIGQDMYVQLLGSSPDDKILRPGAPKVVVQQPADRMRGAAITPLAVVYADGTAVGEPKPIEQIFARRRADAQALADVVPRLDVLVQGRVDAAALTASAYFDAAARQERVTGVYRSLTDNLTHVSKSATPDADFRVMLEHMRRQLALAQEHSVRRQ